MAQSSGPRLRLAPSCQDVVSILMTQNDFSSANQYIPIPGSRSFSRTVGHVASPNTDTAVCSLIPNATFALFTWLRASRQGQATLQGRGL